MAERGRGRGTERRTGDAAAIAGDYQHRALTSGSAVQRYWHQCKLELLQWFWTPARGARVLDLGCGSGVVSDALARAGARVTGVDASPAAIAYARATFGRDGVAFREGVADALDLEPASFDAAVCLEVVEHVHAHQAADLLAGLRRVLRPGGELLLSTPNYRGLWPLIEWAADRFGGVARMDADQHVTRFHRKRLRRFLEDAGFAVVRLRTFSTVAPFAAPLSRGLARGLDRIERRVDLPFGSILVALARTPA
jgi:2-polyprenyl-3-methyl-5-hydroxy-6-metoxy-1,4-benzoquinol methylase